MFFGKIITKDAPFVYNESEVEEVFGDVITISNITLAPSSKDHASVFIKKDGEEFLICTLTHQNPHLAVNLYVEVAEYVEIIVKGNGIVHIIGFFEPENVELNHLSDQGENEQLSIQKVAPIEVKKGQKEEVIKVKSAENKPIQNVTEIEEPIENVDVGNSSDSDESEEDGDISEDNCESEESNLKGLQDLDDDIGDEKPTKHKNHGVQKLTENKESKQPNNHKQHNYNGKPNQHQNSFNHNQHQQSNKNNNNQNNNKNHQNIKINGQHKHFESKKKNKQQKQH